MGEEWGLCGFEMGSGVMKVRRGIWLSKGRIDEGREKAGQNQHRRTVCSRKGFQLSCTEFIRILECFLYANMPTSSQPINKPTLVNLDQVLL